MSPLCSHHPDILFQMSKATDYKQNNNLESPRRTVYYHFHLVSKVPPDNVQTHPMSSLYPVTSSPAFFSLSVLSHI